MWTWSGVVLPILTIASVMAATRSRFCWSVRPAYHWIVMFGMGASRLLESLHVLGKVGGERVRLHGAVGVEADAQILAQLRAGVALAVEPAPRLVAAVETDLVRLAEHPQERGLVGLPGHDHPGVRGSELMAELDRDAPGEP